MFEACGWRCGIDSTRICTQAHHIKPNTKVNNMLYPTFLHSPFNLLPVNHDVHLSQPLPKPPSDLMCAVFEKWLRGEIK